MFSPTTLATLLLTSLPLISAHMHLADPRPLNMGTGPGQLNGEAYDWWVGRLGGQRPQFGFPCLGQLSHFESAPVAAEWTAGSNTRFSLGGSSPHYGGSCQASISIDGGRTWKVMKSWVGACPNRSGPNQDFEFNLAKEVPAGTHLFSWSWHNREREMYHNCAKVRVSNPEPGAATTLEEFPDMLVANIDETCATPDGTAETGFPDEGPADRIQRGDGEYPIAPPTGSGCRGPRTSGGTPRPITTPPGGTTGEPAPEEKPPTGETPVEKPVEKPVVEKPTTEQPPSNPAPESKPGEAVPENSAEHPMGQPPRRPGSKYCKRHGGKCSRAFVNRHTRRGWQFGGHEEKGGEEEWCAC